MGVCGRNDRRLWIVGAGQIAIFALLTLLFAGSPLRAQSARSAATPAPPATDPLAAPFTFDVASIKPGNPNTRPGNGGFLATGLRITNLPLDLIVLSAYYPPNAGNKLIGMPAWTSKENYSIDARIDEASAPAWLKLNPRQWQIAGRPMLQKLLAERCKLVVHPVPGQVDGYALVIGKSGSRLQPAHPHESYPDGVKNFDPEGGKILNVTASDSNIVTFFNVLIPDLANLIGGMSGSIVADQTSLSGRYDFTIRRQQIPVDAEGKRLSDPQPSDFWDLSGTGLEIRPAKIASENLVIDHIERPSPN